MSLHDVYRRRKRKQGTLTLFLLLTLLSLLWLSLISGSEGVRLQESLALLHPNTPLYTIVEAIRLPRALAALVVGMLLGLSGVVMQGVLRNPLASPFTLGISQAAAFGASFAIILFEPNSHHLPTWLDTIIIPTFAFLASMLCSLFILWVGKKVGMRPTALILCGVGLGALFHAGTMFLQYFTTEINAAATLFWTFGDLSKASYTILGLLALACVLILAFVWSSHWQFDALGFGDESAFNKGVHVKQFRTLMLLLSSLCTALAVAFFGIIGFIGLVAPHLVRLILGSSHGALIPLSALSGGILLMGADLVARMLFYPSTLPVGILTSLIGAPMLLYLLIVGKKFS